MKSALSWFVLIAGGVAHAEPRPSIVLFIADDVSAGDSSSLLSKKCEKRLSNCA